jgi:hypothetical protein
VGWLCTHRAKREQDDDEKYACEKMMRVH